MMRIVPSSVVLVLAVAVVGPAPGQAVDGTSTDISSVLSDLNRASGGAVAIVLMDCEEYFPEIVRIHNGDTITWQWADSCGMTHTVTSSGSTLDPDEDLSRPQPSFAGNCFDSANEPPGRQISQTDPLYSVDLDFAGVVVRDLGTLDPRACPLDSSVRLEGGSLEAIVPYFCRNHGQNEPAGEGMRGAIVIAL